MEEIQNRDFKGIWIPKEVWLDDRLNALDKIILMEIHSLDNEQTGCYASNKYLAEFCQCTETKISTAISKLKELGYIELASFDGRHRILKIKSLSLKNLKSDIKNFKSNNINNNIDYINNTIINNSIMEKPKTPFSKLENDIIEEEKPKKKRQLTKSQKNAIQCNQILENFLQYEPPAIQEALKTYVEVRKSKGLQPGQLQIILEEFKREYNGKPQSIVLEQIRKATARGWLMLVYKDTFTGKPTVSYGTKPNFDNTSNHNIPKAVASMTPEERKNYEENELARDENGNFIKF